MNENTFTIYIISSKSIVSVQQTAFDTIQSAKTYIDGMAAAFIAANKRLSVMMFVPKQHLDTDAHCKSIHRNMTGCKYDQIVRNVHNHYKANYCTSN